MGGNGKIDGLMGMAWSVISNLNATPVVVQLY